MFKFSQLVPSSPNSSTASVQTLSTALSTLAYSIVVVLLVYSVRHLLKSTHNYPKGMKPFLYVYLVVMSMLSTLSVIQELVYIAKDDPASAVRSPTFPTGTSQPAVLFGVFDVPISLPFTVWGADIFMVWIWRYMMIYHGTSPAIRSSTIFLLVSLSLVSLGGGIFFFLQPVMSIINGVVFIVLTTSITNILLSSLTASRLLYYDRKNRKRLGAFRDSTYSRAVAICVESCALIVLVSGVFVVLYYANTHSAFLLPLVLLPHTCVISPMLIISRVATGRSHVSTLELSQIQTPEALVRDMEEIGGTETHVTVQSLDIDNVDRV